MPIPEIIPFRLSRDVVDGMGVCGLDGPFTRSCQFTLSVLRDEAKSIDTILNVLRHDPLYSWTLSPVKAKKFKSKMTNSNGEENPANDSTIEIHAEAPNRNNVDTFISSNPEDGGEAERVLENVRNKLSKELSVEASVRRLILEAKDPANLSQLFVGWSPFY